MTQSYKSPGSILTLTAPYARATSGLGAKVGAIFGVSCDTVANAVEGQFETEGVHSLAKTSAQAWAVGDRIYWDDSNKRCDTDSAVGMLIGYCTAVADNPSSNGELKLSGRVSDLSEGAQAAEAALTGTLTGTANGSMVDIAASAGACAGGATPTATQVDTAIATAVATIVTGTNEQLKELQTKLNATLAKLVLAGILDA